MIARLLYGIPYVTTYGYRYHTFSAVEGHRLSSLYLRLLEPLVVRLAAGVIVTTQELASYVGRFVPEARIHLIPNGVDTALFAPSEQVRRSDDCDVTTLLFIGRLTRQKNLSRLLEALSVLAQRHPIRLQVIGEGPLRQELQAEAVRLRVDCTFVGTVPHPSLPGYINKADIFVLPSMIEGHPKALIEAMSCGVPCVVSDCQGNRMVVENERSGLLFNPTSLDQMSAQIERALLDPRWARALGRAARRQVRTKYDLPRLLEQETTLLRTLADRGAA
jgi:glycosyltransferase involved in cell wall biosynthesis